MITKYGKPKQKVATYELSEELRSAAQNIAENQFRAIFTDFDLDKVSGDGIITISG
jgi:hypothetical protein